MQLSSAFGPSVLHQHPWPGLRTCGSTLLLRLEGPTAPKKLTHGHAVTKTRAGGGSLALNLPQPVLPRSSSQTKALPSPLRSIQMKSSSSCTRPLRKNKHHLSAARIYLFHPDKGFSHTEEHPCQVLGITAGSSTAFRRGRGADRHCSTVPVPALTLIKAEGQGCHSHFLPPVEGLTLSTQSLTETSPVCGCEGHQRHGSPALGGTTASVHTQPAFTFRKSTNLKL